MCHLIVESNTVLLLTSCRVLVQSSPVVAHLESGLVETPTTKAGFKTVIDEFRTPHDKPFKICLGDPLFRIDLRRSPQRTTSKMNVLKDLGEDGTLSVFQCTETGLIFIHYVDKDGVKMLDAELDLQEVCSVLKGRAGEDNCFYVDALNSAHSAGGTTIIHAKTPSKATSLRRFFFSFESLEELTITLYHVFGKNIELVKEFFKMDGKMTEFKKTLPCHYMSATEDDMDTVDDGTEVGTGPVSAFVFEEDEGYNPGGESQPLY